MNPRLAGLLSIVIFGAWLVFNVVMVSTGHLADPWHAPSLYTNGGALFAMVSGGLGTYAMARGRGTLSKNLRSAATVAIIGSASFLLLLVSTAMNT